MGPTGPLWVTQHSWGNTSGQWGRSVWQWSWAPTGWTRLVLPQHSSQWQCKQQCWRRGFQEEWPQWHRDQWYQACLPLHLAYSAEHQEGDHRQSKHPGVPRVSAGAIACHWPQPKTCSNFPGYDVFTALLLLVSAFILSLPFPLPECIFSSLHSKVCKSSSGLYFLYCFHLFKKQAFTFKAS